MELVVDSAGRQSACNALPALTTATWSEAAMADSTPITPVHDDEEIWRPVPFAEHAADYEVSNHGRVRRSRSGPGTFAGKVLARRLGRKGYDFCAMVSKGHRTDCQVHILVALAFIGPKPSPQHEVAHWDGNSAHNHVSNLRWATPVENQADVRRHGRQRSVLTAEQVLEIRARYRAGGISHSGLAKKYGVVQATISVILAKKTWRHLP